MQQLLRRKEMKNMNMKARYIAIGIIVGIAIVGCLGAITTDNEGQRFVEINARSNGTTFILDTKTGTVNKYYTAEWDSEIPQTVVYPFINQTQ